MKGCTPRTLPLLEEVAPMTDSECCGCGAAVDGGRRVCDRCEVLEVDTSNCSAGWRAEMRYQGVRPGRGEE